MRKPPRDNPPLELMLTIVEAARACKVDPHTIRRWIANPALRFPHMRTSGTKRGRILIPLERYGDQDGLKEWLAWQIGKQNAPTARKAAA